MRSARLKFLAVCFLVCGLASTAHRPEQLPLNATTREEASRLRAEIAGEMLSVKDTAERVRELARIPDPTSLATFERVMLDGRRFASPIRRDAVLALAEYRGVADEVIADLLTRALDEESVREVRWEIARVLEIKRPRIPEAFRTVAGGCVRSRARDRIFE